GAERPVLLKNPWDYGNFLFVKSAFPHAKFIFIHRHPARVIDSQLRAVRSLYESRNNYLDLLVEWYRRAYSRPIHRHLIRKLLASSLGFRITFRHVRRVNSYFLANVGLLPASDHISVRYEDLCQDLQTNVDKVLRVLGFPNCPRIEHPLAIQL